MTQKVDKLVEKYIQLRESKAKIEAENSARLAPYEEALNLIENALLETFIELGVTSVKTEFGTAYTSVRTTASLADWDVFREFCSQQDDPYAFVERRISKAAVEEYRNAHSDLPPGVNWSETRKVNFRRS
jgi:hypothetical protein